ncbi:regulatory protein, FmdB family [Leptothrix cholodnii SP-6]|uniref:Regulatory protein, FmdB family n=1 Tax=Leptothrix cholodnii (strain ATCC 51168 / LMG 8142 / SP-6) TaxID=395495 RepID=B1XWR6_LEPCP|nr:FmdB family zinc ribbon protein [Leptothrix cholodnii]ACB36265.1 regulatory protein, FmdB family [Leptothrix cholodnii SP-6]
MPIYAYRCSACGHAKDVLQKISDPVLSTCPACGAESFSKQLSAPGFQLKGSGWYATDFRNGGAATTGAAAAATASDSSAAAPAGDAASPASGSATSPPAACGGSCACH